MKRKKLWIVLGSVIASMLAVCVVFALVFRLKTVDVEFRAKAENTNLEEGVLEKVKDTGEFDFGGNILFMDFNKNIQKIEKSNPFIKVEQVVRHFPNIVRVYISERVPRYRVLSEEQDSVKWYILDEDFKILDKVSNADLTMKQVCGDSNYYIQTTEITKETITLKSTAVIGEFVNDATKDYMYAITSGIYGKTKDTTAVRSIDYSKVTNTFTLTMRNESYAEQHGTKIVIEGTDDLYDKAVAAAVCFIGGQAPEVENDKRIENAPTETIIIEKGLDGKYYALKQN